MSTLNEYNKKTISAQEFEQWKSTWTAGQEIPEQIHHYIQSVVLPRISDYADKILSSIK